MSERTWIPTADVQVGDQLAHKLSDTPWTYTRVTGWSDKTFSDGTVHRIFAVAGAPWWVDENSRTADLAREALVATCGSLPEPPPDDMATAYGDPCPNYAAGIACDCGTHPAPDPVTRVILGDDWHGYRMPVPSRYNADIMASLDDRWAVLGSIGIGRRDDTTPLGAWRDAVADETGVDRAELDPARGGRLDLGFAPACVRTFVFYLA